MEYVKMLEVNSFGEVEVTIRPAGLFFMAFAAEPHIHFFPASGAEYEMYQRQEKDKNRGGPIRLIDDYADTNYGTQIYVGRVPLPNRRQRQEDFFKNEAFTKLYYEILEMVQGVY